jgi:hypothetical protein
VITTARAGPISTISIAISTNASAVQTSPSTTTDASPPALGTRLGASSSASGVSTAAATARLAPIVARGSRSARCRLRISGPAE